MFTGIVEGLGEVVSVESSPDGGLRLRLRLGALASGVPPGGSIAVDGVCLTAMALAGGEATFDVGEETVHRTTIADFRPGRRVNIERPLTPQSPLGGHFVQGHVDGRAVITSIVPRPGGRLMEFHASQEIVSQLVAKGSVAVDGVSLTVVEAAENRFSVFLIPHTCANTTLGAKRVGEAVNIETDILGKYVARYLAVQAGRTGPSGRARTSGSGGGLTEEKLKELGFA